MKFEIFNNHIYLFVSILVILKKCRQWNIDEKIQLLYTPASRQLVLALDEGHD